MPRADRERTRDRRFIRQAQPEIALAVSVQVKKDALLGNLDLVESNAGQNTRVALSTVPGTPQIRS